MAAATAAKLQPELEQQEEAAGGAGDEEVEEGSRRSSGASTGISDEAAADDDELVEPVVGPMPLFVFCFPTSCVPALPAACSIACLLAFACLRWKGQGRGAAPQQL